MGELYIKTKNLNGRTVLSDSFFTAPYKTVSPFYNGHRAEIMIMQASAGVLDGDRYKINLDMGKNTRTIITSQSYTKIFKMDRDCAKQSINISVGENAELIYFPSPVIPFEGSEFMSENTVDLSENSKFIICDILAAGRVGMGEKFKFKRYHSRTEVRTEGKLAFVDNTLLRPSSSELFGIGFFEGYTHQGMVYEYGFDDNFKSAPKAENLTSAVTETKRGRLLRILANSGDDIVRYVLSLIKTLD